MSPGSGVSSIRISWTCGTFQESPHKRQRGDFVIALTLMMTSFRPQVSGCPSRADILLVVDVEAMVLLGNAIEIGGRH